MDHPENPYPSDPSLAYKAKRAVLVTWAASLQRDRLNPAPLSVADVQLGRVRVIGPTTGYHHRLYREKVRNARGIAGDVRRLVLAREACLVARGWHTHVGKWAYSYERESDGDAYLYDHFAVNRTTGARVDLDAPYSQAHVDADEFMLHVLLKFPDRAKYKKGGPLRREDLEKVVFGKLV